MPLTDCEQPSHSLCLLWGRERTGQRLVSKCQVCPRSRGTSGLISPCCWEQTQLSEPLYGESLSVDFLPVILTSYGEGERDPYKFIRKLPAGTNVRALMLFTLDTACKILSKLSHSPQPQILIRDHNFLGSEGGLRQMKAWGNNPSYMLLGI